jgi:hypothetical protein
MVLDNILSIILSTFVTLIVLVIIGFIVWNYYSENIIYVTNYIEDRQNKIEELINLYDKISEFPALINKYKYSPEVQNITTLWNNFIKPIPGSEILRLANEAITNPNIEIQKASIMARARAILTQEIPLLADRINNTIRNHPAVVSGTGVVNWAQSMEDGWNRMGRDWHNFWGGRFSQMSQNN